MNLEELSKICDESGAKLKNKMVMAISKYGKHIYEMNPDDWIALLKGFKIQTSSILEIRREAIKIYEYGIWNKKTVYNPFLTPELSVDNISAQLNQFIYVSQEQLDRAIGNLSDDVVAGCIIQMMYEGAKTFLDIFELDMDNIDFENSIIKFNGYTINASEKLMGYIKDYNENDVYITRHYNSKTGKRSFKLKRVRENSFVKIIEYSDYTGDMLSSGDIKTFRNSCTQFFMKLGYSSSQIYNSGMINYILKKCDYSLDEFSLLFKDGSKQKFQMTPSKRLAEYAKEYGFKSKNIRYYLKDYYNSFMLQNTPF